MHITLRPVTADNYYDVSLLTTNVDGIPTLDEEFICCNALSLAESKYFPDLQPQALYDGEVPVGFILWGPYVNDQNNYWVLRYMIDYRHQGKGYGKRAFRLFIEELRMSEVISELYLGLDPSNKKAISLYTSCGFEFTGHEKDGEKVYRLQVQ
ncbi:GNAT family N-acetyltransferase [Sphingobacterium paucimobilis]|uniref:N-acetyltransferase domain-containing protein n=1 Tax=Sphingobacterium paucimobilis HER1398 TaxID=1346330 RepID=U2JB36_9SPHI|nr:GNAT family N-acetyltransferase [Sphingobacterium paucimobilis]ERJ59878.1 hypothetical protein M472_13990 [Sphingobacterium paucimobilis HER1398]